MPRKQQIHEPINQTYLCLTVMLAWLYLELFIFKLLIILGKNELYIDLSWMVSKMSPPSGAASQMHFFADSWVGKKQATAGHFSVYISRTHSPRIHVSSASVACHLLRLLSSPPLGSNRRTEWFPGVPEHLPPPAAAGRWVRSRACWRMPDGDWAGMWELRHCTLSGGGFLWDALFFCLHLFCVVHPAAW